MCQLTAEELADFRKYWKTLKKDVLVDKLEEMLQYISYQANEIEDLKALSSQANINYLARCRSVGGVTLPPGV